MRKMPSNKKLAQVVRNFARFLGASRAPGAEFWARQLSNVQETYARTPVRLATEILGFYGGMGSLNDVVFRPGRDRDRYDKLKEDVYTLAQSVARQPRRKMSSRRAVRVSGYLRRS
jgi:hypothetical protein